MSIILQICRGGGLGSQILDGSLLENSFHCLLRIRDRFLHENLIMWLPSNSDAEIRTHFEFDAETFVQVCWRFLSNLHSNKHYRLTNEIIMPKPCSKLNLHQNPLNKFPGFPKQWNPRSPAPLVGCEGLPPRHFLAHGSGMAAGTGKWRKNGKAETLTEIWRWNLRIVLMEIEICSADFIGIIANRWGL